MSHSSTMTFQTEFGKYWTRMVDWIRFTWETVEANVSEDPTFSLPFGTYDRLSVSFGEENGDPYVEFGFMFPDGCYAVIEDQTYGELQAIRIYKESD
jgi:hypothetical protein